MSNDINKREIRCFLMLTLIKFYCQCSNKSNESVLAPGSVRSSRVGITPALLNFDKAQ